MGKHPENAAYVSADGLVSFDRFGVKLDSNGNRVYDRQRAGDAGASPIQRREEERPQAQAAASYSFPANATGQPVQRSAWDNSIVQPAQGAASAAGVSGPRMGNNPNVLSPNGVDESFLGLPYPTARNGLLGSQWAKPWQGAPASSASMPTQLSDEYRRRALAMMDEADRTMGGGASIPMQTGGLDVRPQQMRSYVPPSVETPSVFPNPPRYDSFDNIYLPDPWVGRGEQAQGSYLRIPNVYQPETYTRPLDVYDPNQLSWMVP